MSITQNYTLNAPKLQFYLEPKEIPSGARAEEVYFDDDGDLAQCFSAFRNHAAIGTPPKTSDCIIEIELAENRNDISHAQQVFSFPLEVDHDNDLYLRSLDDCEDTRQISIPAGKYDVLVQFFDPIYGEQLDDWHVRISFLPGGKIGASCLKLVDCHPPEKLFLHVN